MMTERDTEDDTRCDEWESEDGPQGSPPNTQCVLDADHAGEHVFEPERDWALRDEALRRAAEA